MKVGDKKGDAVADVLTLLDRRVGKERDFSVFSTEEETSKADQSDEVSLELGLAKALSIELDPTKMAEERRVRFENIKKQVQSGTYQEPSRELLARSLVDELDVEIATSATVAGE